MPFPIVTSTAGSLGGAPVRRTTYGQYNYYQTPQTIGNRIGGTSPGYNPAGGGGSSSTTRGNPQAEEWLGGVLAGKNLPFSPFTQSQMLSQQSDMSAAAEGARNQQMMNAAASGGASASDPSMAAAKMSNMAARQVQNQTAARDIGAQAAQRNFGAQMDAAGILNQNAMQRAQWQQAAASGAGAGMAFSPFGSGMGGGGYGSGRSMPFGGYHGIGNQQAADMLYSGDWRLGRY